VGKRQQRQRRETEREALRVVTPIVRPDLDAVEIEDLVEKMIVNQLEPQERARELRARGIDARVALVNVAADAEGYRVTCVGCKRTATIPTPLPPGRAVLCPRCQRGES
jgi:hypothetical protein